MSVLPTSMEVIVNREARVTRMRWGERVAGPIARCRCARLPLGGWFLHSAEPDIHLLPRAPGSRRRRSSLDSLPVPKQYEESLGSRLRRPAGDLRDLAACASIILMFLPSVEGFYAAAVRRNSAAGTKSVLRLSTAIISATIFLATASVARLPFPRCRSLSWSRASSAL
jgi:hypothetical protein